MNNNELLNQTSLKEYYVNLHRLYNNALNMLNGINQSLNTNAKNINISLLNNDSTITNVTIPSFLYLESRIEELYNNFNNIVNLPKSGDGWLQSDGNSFKINVAQSNTAPNVPTILSNDNIKASAIENVILNDFINPRTTLRLNLSDVAQNISQIAVKKIIIYSESIYNNLLANNCNTYEDYHSVLYNFYVDSGYSEIYKEYDITVNIPYKYDKYVSEFKILDIPINDDNSSNPSYYNEESHRLSYDLVFDTLEYHERNAPEKIHYLKKGDFITLINSYGIYEIANIYEESVGDYIQYHITVEEYVGHNYLQTTQENPNMVFKIYKQNNINEPTYIDIPIDDNQYMILFVASIYNNVKSNYSEGLPIDLNSVYMANYDTQEQLDANISYIEYYNKYCMNIGSIINNISALMFPGPKDITVDDLKALQTDSDLIAIINSTNFNDFSIKDIRQLTNNSDNTFNSLQSIVQLKNNNKNLLTTAIDSLHTVSQSILEAQASNDKNQLVDLLVQKTQIESDIQKLHENISANAQAINNSKLNIYTKTPEYHIRGVIDTSAIESFMKEHYPKVSIIGMDVEYKYRLAGDSLDTENVESTSSAIFSNWTKMPTFDKTKTVKIDDYNNVIIALDETDNIDNDVKWNQIDIPIKEDDIVIVRIRYKYSIGQPFISIYSPWSDETPIEWDSSNISNMNDIQEILNQNDQDIMLYNMMSRLDTYGYSAHINSKIDDINSGISYFHSADNIFSGFKDQNNIYLSLKDKLMQMDSILAKYDSIINEYTNTQYEIDILFEDSSYEILPNSFKIINIPLINSTSDISISHTIDICIKNTGANILKLYSLFCGDKTSDVYSMNELQSINTNQVIYDDLAKYNYMINDIVFAKDSADTIFEQKYNQLLYFRNNSPFKTTNILDSSYDQTTNSISFSLNKYDINNSIYIYPSTECINNIKIDDIGWDKITNLAFKQISPGNSVSLGLVLKYTPNKVQEITTEQKYQFYFDIKTNASSRRDVLHYGFILNLIPSSQE